MCVVAEFDRLVRVGRAAAGCACEHAWQTSSPTVAAFVVGQSTQECVVGRLLQVQVKSCVNSESRFMNLLCTVLFFQVLSDLFDEVWRQPVWIIVYAQSYGCIPGCRTVGFADSAVRDHFLNDEITSSESSFWIPD